MGAPAVEGAVALARPRRGQALEDGGRVVVLCAVETTVEPTRAIFAEAAARTDRSGGPYRYACDAFGPYVGFAVGWVLTVAVLGTITAVWLVGMVFVLVLLLLGQGGVGGTLEDLAPVVEGLALHGMQLPVIEMCAVAPLLLQVPPELAIGIGAAPEATQWAAIIRPEVPP